MKPRVVLLALAAILAATAGLAFAQGGTPPPAVAQAFAAAYPSAARVEWEQEHGNWEAEFRQNGREINIRYSPQGQLQQTERDIAPAELPAAVQQGVARDYPGHTVHEATVVELPGGTQKYDVEARKGGHETEALYSADGTRLSEEDGHEHGGDDRD